MAGKERCGRTKFKKIAINFWVKKIQEVSVLEQVNCVSFEEQGEGKGLVLRGIILTPFDGSSQ